MKTREKAAVAIGILALLGIGYAVYFDHKRRNDPKFRRRLKRQRKRAEKQRNNKAEAESDALSALISSALARCDEEPAPTSLEGKEKYFMEQVSLGEALIPKGAAAYEDAAVHFYRALRVYPSPMELVMVFQKTIPAPLFQIIMGMMQLELVRKQEKYYELFPPAEMNVRLQKLEEIPQPDGTKIVKRALIAAKDFDVGDVIFTEKPIAASLHPALEKSRFCAHCLKYIPPNEPCRVCSECGERARYCSKTCETEAKDNYHLTTCPGGAIDGSEKAKALRELAAKSNGCIPLMVSQFLTQTVQTEQRRALAGEAEEEYGVWEHLERLKYLELSPTAQEINELSSILGLLSSKVAGIEEFFTSERYMVLKGRILYNSYAITSDVEDPKLKDLVFSEAARHNGKGKRIGTGLYIFSSHLTHSCLPNCEVRFQTTDSGYTLSLVALERIKKGDQLNISYVSSSPDDHYTERRDTLAKNWRFKCTCSRCKAEEMLEPLRDDEPLLVEKSPNEIAAEAAEHSSEHSSEDEVEVIAAEPSTRGLKLTETAEEVIERKLPTEEAETTKPGVQTTHTLVFEVTPSQSNEADQEVIKHAIVEEVTSHIENKDIQQAVAADLEAEVDPAALKHITVEESIEIVDIPVESSVETSTASVEEKATSEAEAEAEAEATAESSDSATTELQSSWVTSTVSVEGGSLLGENEAEKAEETEKASPDAVTVTKVETKVKESDKVVEEVFEEVDDSQAPLTKGEPQRHLTHTTTTTTRVREDEQGRRITEEITTHHYVEEEIEELTEEEALALMAAGEQIELVEEVAENDGVTTITTTTTAAAPSKAEETTKNDEPTIVTTAASDKAGEESDSSSSSSSNEAASSIVEVKASVPSVAKKGGRSKKSRGRRGRS